MNVRRLFVSRTEGRLRSGWRLLLFHMLLVASTLAAGVVAGQVSAAVPWASMRLVALQLAVALAWVLSVAIAARYLDRRPFAAFGFHLDRGWWIDLAFGVALGAVLVAGIFLVELAAGWVAIVGTFRSLGYGAGDPFPIAFLAAILFMVGVGVGEETWTRGYLLRNLAEGLAPRPFGPRKAVLAALVISSVVFSALHLLNPNASLLGAINIVVVGVLLLGGSYVLTGELAIPIGFHVGWNLALGSIFGMPVSGVDVLAATVLQVERRGPELWTGGAFGPEGGLLGFLAILAGALLMAAWIRTRHGTPSIRTELAHHERPVSGSPPASD